MRSIIRKRNVMKSIKARTTGKFKRKIKSSINPFYGKKGIDYVTDPKRAIYNKIYNKTTFKIPDEVWIHIGLFIFTAGIGNIIYLIVKRKK